MNGVSFTGGGGEGHRCSSKECWQLFSAALYRFNKASFLYILWAWTQKETSSWEDEKTNCSLSKWKLISSISDRNPSSSYLSAGYSHYDYQIPSGPVSSCKLVTQSPVWKTCCLKFMSSTTEKFIFKTLNVFLSSSSSSSTSSSF